MLDPNRKSGGSSATPPPTVLNFDPIRDPRLDPRACQVLWALGFWAWGKKAYCWPTNEQIAELVNCSPRTVVFALKKLVDAGYITRHMNRSGQGWYRSIVILDRVPAPILTIVEPPAPSDPGGGRATDCATPPTEEGGGRAIHVDTPAPSIARPLAQSIAREDGIENQKEEEKELAEATSPKEGGSPRPRQAEPEWLKVDNLDAAQVEHWRKVAAETGPNDPFGKIARKIVARIEKGENTTAPGSPAKDPRGPSIEGDAPSKQNLSRRDATGQ